MSQRGADHVELLVSTAGFCAAVISAWEAPTSHTFYLFLTISPSPNKNGRKRVSLPAHETDHWHSNWWSQLKCQPWSWGSGSWLQLLTTAKLEWVCPRQESCQSDPGQVFQGWTSSLTFSPHCSFNKYSCLLFYSGRIHYIYLDYSVWWALTCEYAHETVTTIKMINIPYHPPLKVSQAFVSPFFFLSLPPHSTPQKTMI